MHFTACSIHVKATRWQHLPSVVGVHDKPYILEVSFLSSNITIICERKINKRGSMPLPLDSCTGATL